MKYSAALGCLFLFAALASPADAASPPAFGPTREAALEQNPFSGLYDCIDSPVMTADKYSRLIADFLFNCFMQENPKADRRKARLLAEISIEARDSFPDSEPLVTQEEKEPIDELFRIINLSEKGKLSGKEMQRRLYALKLKYPVPGVTRVQIAKLILSYSEGEQRKSNRRLATGEWTDLLKSRPFPMGDYLFLYNFISNSCPAKTWKELDKYYDQSHPLDPWMRSMIAGRAAIIRAWDARGGSWASSVTPEGWRVFHLELQKARKELLNAAELHPDRPEPYLRLITVEMGDGSIGDCIEMFRQAIRLMPDYAKSYNAITWALQPRWGGSHELIFQLAETAINTGKYDLNVPSAGVDVIGLIIHDSAWRWKNWYRRPGIPEKVDACYAYQLEHGDAAWTSFILMHKMTFEMATLRYGRALETRKKIPLDDKAFHDFWAERSWRGNNAPGAVPRIPTYCDPVPLLELFTGEHGAQLQAIEREYLDGNPDAAYAKLAEFIRTAKLTKEEKTLLIDLYGRWRLPAGGEDYYGGSELHRPFLVAARTGAGNVMTAMIDLGYDYSAFEDYPGETAVRTARCNSASESFDVLKKAGDPLNRPDPKYGRTPLQTASFHNKPKIVEKLLALGCPADTPDRENHTPLQLAASKGTTKIIGILLKAGADPDVEDNDGDNALMFAIQTGRDRAVWEPLVLAVKQVNHRNNSGRTVLHYAAEYKGSPELVQQLLKRGADPKLKDNSGKTPADIARAKGNPALAELLAQ